MRKPDTKKIQSSTSGISRNVTTANEQRALDAYNRVVDVLEGYIKSGNTIPTQKEMTAQASVSPDTFRKHHKVWENKGKTKLFKTSFWCAV